MCNSHAITNALTQYLHINHAVVQRCKSKIRLTNIVLDKQNKCDLRSLCVYCETLPSFLRDTLPYPSAWYLFSL